MAPQLPVYIYFIAQYLEGGNIGQLRDEGFTILTHAAYVKNHAAQSRGLRFSFKPSSRTLVAVTPVYIKSRKWEQKKSVKYVHLPSHSMDLVWSGACQQTHSPNIRPVFILQEPYVS